MITFQSCDHTGEATRRLAPTNQTWGTTLTMEEPMGDEQLTTFQEANLKWLKRQVDNLQDEQHRADARPRVQQELWAAREELDNYVKTLREHGIKI
jgi:hypothetical protein